MVALIIRSHPSWVCGLKLEKQEGIEIENGSHPSWVCGLKRLLVFATRAMCVTPFVGVWIETIVLVVYPASSESHPSWVCGLKPNLSIFRLLAYQSHPSWVCGLKH